MTISKEQLEANELRAIISCELMGLHWADARSLPGMIKRLREFKFNEDSPVNDEIKSLVQDLQDPDLPEYYRINKKLELAKCYFLDRLKEERENRNKYLDNEIITARLMNKDRRYFDEINDKISKIEMLKKLKAALSDLFHLNDKDERKDLGRNINLLFKRIPEKMTYFKDPRKVNEFDTIVKYYYSSIIEEIILIANGFLSKEMIDETTYLGLLNSMTSLLTEPNKDIERYMLKRLDSVVGSGIKGLEDILDDLKSSIHYETYNDTIDSDETFLQYALGYNSCLMEFRTISIKHVMDFMEILPLTYRNHHPMEERSITSTELVALRKLDIYTQFANLPENGYRQFIRGCRYMYFYSKAHQSVDDSLSVKMDDLSDKLV